MTLNVYDGCNIIYRALNDTSLHAAKGMNLRQRYHALQRSDIWVFDGHGHNARRREIYPPYKMKRPPTPMNITAQLKLFKQLLVHSPATMIEVEGWEGDDIIGTLARTGRPMMIHSTDMDYAQLLKLPNVKLNGVNTKDVPARWVPLYKATRGDSSDDIAGIPGFGPKAWDNLLPHLERFEKAVVSGDPALFTGFPLTPIVTRWLSLPENVKLLQSMLLVTHIFQVPNDELNAGITVGKHDPEAADRLLSQYFL